MESSNKPGGQAEVNLLELCPVRNVSWEMAEQEQVVLLIPKFKSRFAVKYIMPMLAKPNFRIKLDAYGSFLWQRFDGDTPVRRIAESMKDTFGESVEPVYDRIGKFIRALEKEKFILIPTATSGQPCLN